jgi:hypothetical protein
MEESREGTSVTSQILFYAKIPRKRKGYVMTKNRE